MTHGHLLGNDLFPSALHCAHSHGSLDGSGHDAVGGDAAPGVLCGDDAGQGNDAGLGRAVVGLTAVAHLTNGGDVDDTGNEPNNSNSDKGPTENDLPIIWG